MVSPHPLHPVHRFGPRGRGDHRQPGQRTGQLDRDGTHTARAANHQQRQCSPRDRALHVKTIKERLPAGQRREGQGGGILVAQAFRHMRGDACIHRLQLRIAAGPVDGSRMEHPITHPETAHVTPHGTYRPHGVPAQDAPAAHGRSCRRAHLRIGRIDGNGLDGHQQIIWPGLRIRQLDVHQRAFIGNGQGLVETYGFHGCSPCRRYWHCSPTIGPPRDIRAHARTAMNDDPDAWYRTRGGLAPGHAGTACRQC